MILTGLIAVFVAGCVNSNGTDALTSSEIESPTVSAEGRYIAGKCNSANRLQISNIASTALLAKYTAFGEYEAGLEAARKERISTDLQNHSTNLQVLDENLQQQCTAFSACEFQASTNKQSCSIEAAKFRESEKQMTNYTQSVERLKVN